MQYKIGRYTISDWQEDANGASRFIVFKDVSNKEINSEIRIQKICSYRNGNKTNTYKYNVIFNYDYLGEDYIKLYNLEFLFPSFKKAKMRVDSFLNKLEKLKCFI